MESLGIGAKRLTVPGILQIRSDGEVTILDITVKKGKN